MPAVMPKSGTRLGSIVPPLLAEGVLVDGWVFAGGVLVEGAFEGGRVAGGPLLPGLPLCRCGKASAVASRAKSTGVSFMLAICKKE